MSEPALAVDSTVANTGNINQETPARILKGLLFFFKIGAISPV